MGGKRRRRGGDDLPRLREDALEVDARRRPQREGEERGRGNDVEGRAAVERGDVHAQSPQARRPEILEALAEIVEGHRGAGQREKWIRHAVGQRRVSTGRGRANARGMDAAMPDSDVAAGRFANHGAFEAAAPLAD